MPACIWDFHGTSRKNSFRKQCWAACSLRGNRASTRQSCATWLLHPVAHPRRQSTKWRRVACGQCYRRPFGLPINGLRRWAVRLENKRSEKGNRIFEDQDSEVEFVLSVVICWPVYLRT